MESFEDVPVIDVQVYLDKVPGRWEEECKKVAESLHKFGILIWKDPTVDQQDNEEYLDLMEEYFDKTSKKFYAGEELDDCKPQWNYQTGVTTEKQERARNHYDLVCKISP